MKRLLNKWTYLLCVPHLVVEADDGLRVDQLLGHYQVEASDLVEFILTLLPVQAAHLVVEAWQPHVRGVVQTAPGFATTLRISARGASASVVERIAWPIEESREEILSVAHGDDALSQTIVLVNKVQLLVYAQARTCPDVHLIPGVRCQMCELQAPRALHVQLRLRPKKPLQVKRILKFTPTRKERIGQRISRSKAKSVRFVLR